MILSDTIRLLRAKGYLSFDEMPTNVDRGQVFDEIEREMKHSGWLDCGWVLEKYPDGIMWQHQGRLLSDLRGHCSVNESSCRYDHCHEFGIVQSPVPYEDKVILEIRVVVKPYPRCVFFFGDGTREEVDHETARCHKCGDTYRARLPTRFEPNCHINCRTTVVKLEEKDNTMKSKNIASLLMENLKTVAVSFDVGNRKNYTYKTTLDLEAGDKVVVETPSNGFQVVCVVEAHDVPQIAPDSSINYKWIVQKVDTSVRDELEAREAEFAKEVLKLEQANVRKQAIAMLGLDTDALSGSIAKLNGKTE